MGRDYNLLSTLKCVVDEDAVTVTLTTAVKDLISWFCSLKGQWFDRQCWFDIVEFFKKWICLKQGHQTLCERGKFKKMLPKFQTNEKIPNSNEKLSKLFWWLALEVENGHNFKFWTNFNDRVSILKFIYFQLIGRD